MTCPSCGRIAQPGAASCINVSCADYQKPFPAAAPVAAAVATRSVADRSIAQPRPLRPVAGLAIAGAAIFALFLALDGPDLGLAIGFALGSTGFLVCVVLKASRVWAVGVWFVPLVNLFLGGRLVVEVARESVAPDDPIARERIVKLALIWSVVSGAALVPAIDWLSPVDAIDPSTTMAVFKLLAIPGAGLFIALVWFTTIFQERRFAPEPLAS